MKTTFFKGIGFGALTAMLLMFSLLLFSCEKEPVEIPIENLELGDTYGGGTVVRFYEDLRLVLILSEGNIGEFPQSEIDEQIANYQGTAGYSDWQIPVRTGYRQDVTWATYFVHRAVDDIHNYNIYDMLLGDIFWCRTDEGVNYGRKFSLSSGITHPQGNITKWYIRPVRTEPY